MKTSELLRATLTDRRWMDETTGQSSKNERRKESRRFSWLDAVVNILFFALGVVASRVLANNDDNLSISSIWDVREDEEMKERETKTSRTGRHQQGPEKDGQEDETSGQPPMTIRDYLVKARGLLEDATSKGIDGFNSVREAQASIDKALVICEASLFSRFLRRWSVLLYIVLAGLAEAFFIELYCRWHGAYFLSLNLYDPANVAKLSTMGFVNGATTMSVAAEVLMWSSLGVWAQGTYDMARVFLTREARYPYDIGGYIGTMVRNTSVAAVVVIILRLTKFSIFGVSLDSTSPLAFDATVGISFLLGFFGDEAYQVISHFRDRLVGDIMKDQEEKVA